MYLRHSLLELKLYPEVIVLERNFFVQKFIYCTIVSCSDITFYFRVWMLLKESLKKLTECKTALHSFT